MSTIAYAALTATRERAAASESSIPNVKTYVDAVAALVPAEVLALHVLAVSYCTHKMPGYAGAVITRSGSETLTWVFFVLIALSSAIYVAAFKRTRPTESIAFWRALIPPAAFVCWTALQQTSAFDAVYPNVAIGPRVIAASISAVGLGYLARLGAIKAATRR